MESIKPFKRIVFSRKILAGLLLLIIFSYILFKAIYKGDPLPPLVSASVNKEMIVSPVSGYYDFPVTVSISNSSPGTVFSVEGEAPSLIGNFYTNSIRLKRPMKAEKLSQIPTSPRWFPPFDIPERSVGFFRAANLTVNGRISNEVSRIYLQSENRSDLPVVSLTVDEADLFDQRKGIYVPGDRYEDKKYYMRHNVPLDTRWWYYPANYKNRGADSERPVSVEYIKNGKVLLTSKAGVRIRGNATRAFAQKSLTIKLDHQKHFSFFDGKDEYTSAFILRNGGNDWSKSMLRDELMQGIMSGYDLELQRYQPVIVYINGEYWGIHNLRDLIDRDFLAEKYKVREDSISILEMPTVLIDGNEYAYNDFSKILSLVATRGCADPLVYSRVKEELDLENLTDFVIANIYFVNSDWPMNNCRLWRTDGDSATGKWKWILFDTDYGFGYTGDEAVHHDMFRQAFKTSDLGILLTGLLKSEEYRTFFYQRFRAHLDKTFTPAKVIRLIDQYEAGIQNEMKYHLLRWRTRPTVNEWKEEVSKLRDFAVRRHSIVSAQLEDYKKRNFVPAP